MTVRRYKMNKLYIEKAYSNGFYELEVLELVIDAEGRPYGLITIHDEYSEQNMIYLSKRDIHLLKDLKPEQALNLVYRWIKEGKVHSRKLAHKRGRYWENDLPKDSDLAVMAKYRKLYGC